MALRASPSGGAEMRRRLTPTTAGSELGNSRLIHDPMQSPWARLVVAIEKRGVSLKDSEGEALAEKLMLAGYTDAYAVRTFVLIKTTLIFALPLLAYLVMSLVGFPSTTRVYMVIAAAATVGTPPPRKTSPPSAASPAAASASAPAPPSEPTCSRPCSAASTRRTPASSCACATPTPPPSPSCCWPASWTWRSWKAQWTTRAY